MSTPLPSPSITLILGGARSGKSTHAERLAQQLGGDHVLYLATAQALDQEMTDRIAHHRAQRPAAWTTLEAPLHPGQALRDLTSSPAVILLDCLTLLVSNLLLAHADDSQDAIQTLILQEIDDLVAAAQALNAHLIIVSNEVGMGLVPDNPLGRTYRDLLGRANQHLAARAHQVLFMVAGLPLTIKAPGQGPR